MLACGSERYLLANDDHILRSALLPPIPSTLTRSYPPHTPRHKHLYRSRDLLPILFSEWSFELVTQFGRSLGLLLCVYVCVSVSVCLGSLPQTVVRLLVRPFTARRSRADRVYYEETFQRRAELATCGLTIAKYDEIACAEDFEGPRNVHWITG